MFYLKSKLIIKISIIFFNSTQKLLLIAFSQTDRGFEAKLILFNNNHGRLN